MLVVNGIGDTARAVVVVRHASADRPEFSVDGDGSSCGVFPYFPYEAPLRVFAAQVPLRAHERGVAKR
jgi:hypothetical protein